MNQTYTVKPGDTLYGISNQFGVSVTELAELNGIQGSNLQIGQILAIPNKSGTNPSNMFMYTVKSGDTLYGIAKKYNTTVQKIIDLNYLKDNNLAIGQVIRIPENYFNEEEMVLPSYINYTVKKGDNLYSIAKDFNINVDVLAKDNALTSDSLMIGQILKIRTPEYSEVVEECFGKEYTPPANTENTINYTVKSGDNLYNIANKYNTSVSAIQRLNNLANNNLSIGQILRIPISSGNITTVNTYTVKRGDSLYSIARQFNTTVSELQRLNNLTNNNLSVGQIIKIPNITSSTTTYIVKSGDNLYSIARRFNTTVDSIKRKNNLTSNLLAIGQKLNI